MKQKGRGGRRGFDPRYLEEENWSLPPVLDHVYSIQLAVLTKRKRSRIQLCYCYTILYYTTMYCILLTSNINDTTALHNPNATKKRSRHDLNTITSASHSLSPCPLSQWHPIHRPPSGRGSNREAPCDTPHRTHLGWRWGRNRRGRGGQDRMRVVEENILTV
jgi:hypothetical protein